VGACGDRNRALSESLRDREPNRRVRIENAAVRSVVPFETPAINIGGRVSHIMRMLDRIAACKKEALEHWIAIVTGLIILLIAALLVLAISKARQDAIAQAVLKASYLSAALQEEAEGSLDTLAIASEFVKRRIETEDAMPPLAELKSEISRYVPGLAAISVIGPDGTLRATSGDVASASLDYAGFEFFRVSRGTSNIGFRLGQPITGLLPNQPIIPATQRLEKKNGELAGLVLFLTDPERATAMFRRVDLGNSGSLVLIGTGGRVFFGYTLPRGLDPSVIGTSAVNEMMLARLQSAASGSYVATSALDGIERIYFWRRLTNFPVIALVGLGKAEALAAANHQARRMLALGVLSAGFLLALTIKLTREISRRTAQALDLEEANAKLAAAYIDIHERERHQKQVHLLLHEVSHRSKNMLTVVQAIARQTAAQNTDDFIERFTKRIQALAASQDLLIKSEWKGVDLHELALSQLGPFKDLAGTRIEVRGPPLLLSASAAQVIGLALHELATNAGKYGALSNDTGRVALHWIVEPREGGGETFVMSWRERGGPVVQEPSETGFGSNILSWIAKESFHAEVELDFAATGLFWRLQCAAGEILDRSRPA